MTDCEQNIIGDNMSLVIIRAFIIYVFVIVAVRIMGKRQVGELKPHELVITFLISSTATIPLQDNNMPLLNCIVPVLLFVSLEIIVAVLSVKSVKFRNLIQGRPIVIIDKGKIDEKKLRQLRFTVDDLCDALRQQGYWDIAEVQNAVIETNGSISAENWEKYKPLTADNVKISVDDKGLHTAIVIDGKPVEEYFKDKSIKLSEIELLLSANGKEAKKLLLMTVDDNGNVYTGVCVFEQVTINNVYTKTSEIINTALELNERKKFEESKEECKKLRTVWQGKYPYLSAMIDHAQLDSANLAIKATKDIRKDDEDELSEKLIVKENQSITLGNIF